MLIFDPYRWIADRRAAAPSPLAPLAALAGGRPEFENSISKATPANPANPSDWCEALAHLDPFHPPGGIEPGRWRALIADARWLAKCHGPAAAALGWTASDLFGVDLIPEWSGLSDRLGGARKLVLAPDIARWESDHFEGKLWRSTLTLKPLLWHLAGDGAR